MRLRVGVSKVETQVPKIDIDEFIQQLKGMVGGANVLHHPDDLLVFEYDGSIDRGMPEVVVFPRSAEEVQKIISLAYMIGVSVVGRGSGTGLSGGAISPPGGIQVAFTRMKSILELDEENRTVIVEPGVINLDLDNYARKFGLRYVPDPSSQKACSIGGNVAENAGGPHCLAYGVTTNHVLGMEVVLADGSVQWMGAETRETPGYDLRGILIGSEGTLADELLAPSVIYAAAVVAVLAAHEVHAVAHVTGGGLPGNLPRVLGEGVDAVVDPMAWEVPRIFRELQDMGGVSDAEMARVFNLGVGMVLVVPPSEADGVVATLASGARPARVIGELVAGTGTVAYSGAGGMGS